MIIEQHELALIASSRDDCRKATHCAVSVSNDENGFSIIAGKYDRIAIVQHHFVDIVVNGVLVDCTDIGLFSRCSVKIGEVVTEPDTAFHTHPRWLFSLVVVRSATEIDVDSCRQFIFELKLLRHDIAGIQRNDCCCKQEHGCKNAKKAGSAHAFHAFSFPRRSAQETVTVIVISC